MRITLGTLTDWVGGRRTTDDVNREILGFSTDSRTLRAGEAFIALKGPNFDGHDFVRDARAKGASVAIVDRAECLDGMYGIVVPDTLHALGAIAHRHRWSQPLIPWVAVTGSNGKTTTREMIARILRTRGPVAATEGNYNNLVGMPMTIVRRTEDAWAGVVELGANAPGEIARLTAILDPTVAVVTSTGPAHLEGFGTVEAVAHEKAQIYSRLPHDGLAIFPAHDPRAGALVQGIKGRRASFGVEKPADMVAENIECTPEGLTFTVRGVSFRLPLLGRHNVANCLAALLAVEHLGLRLEEAAHALQDMTPVHQRLETVRKDAIIVLNDAYNANPASLTAAADALASLPGKRHVAIVGDMMELGVRSRVLHRECGRMLGRKGLNIIIAVGRQAVALAESASATTARSTVRHFTTVQALLRVLSDYVEPGDVVLVKGSRSMRMEQVVDALKNMQFGDTDTNG